MPFVTVREYATLTTEPVVASLDRAQISASAFDWLCRLNTTYRVTHSAGFAEVEDSRHLKLDNYVGVLTTPCGTVIEVLPKVHSDGQEVSALRTLLRRMIMCAGPLTPRADEEADLLRFDGPVHEWVLCRFLAALSHILSRGVRSDYVRMESVETHLRGQLQIAEQVRLPPGRAHLFALSYDELTTDRAENRLIVSALMKTLRMTTSADNWRRAHEYRDLMREIPPSTNIDADFRVWRTERLMAHYAPAKTWCELILRDEMPLSMRGETAGISLLYPMERLFEKYVERGLRGQLAPCSTLTPQSGTWSLTRHQGKNMFQLRPDFLVNHALGQSVLDAKWKLLDQHAPEQKYQLAEQDFYQMLAYASRYMQGRGHMALIYPLWDKFDKTLAPFIFHPHLTLWVLPFNLTTCRLEYSPVPGLEIGLLTSLSQGGSPA